MTHLFLPVNDCKPAISLEEAIKLVREYSYHLIREETDQEIQNVLRIVHKKIPSSLFSQVSYVGSHEGTLFVDIEINPFFADYDYLFMEGEFGKAWSFFNQYRLHFNYRFGSQTFYSKFVSVKDFRLDNE